MPGVVTNSRSSPSSLKKPLSRATSTGRSCTAFMIATWGLVEVAWVMTFSYGAGVNVGRPASATYCPPVSGFVLGIALAPEHGVDRVPQPVGVTLGKVAARAQGKGGEHVGRLVVPGQHEAPEPRPALPRLAQKIQATHSRQRDIHQHQIGSRL